MSLKTIKAYAHFNNVDRYLRQRFDIDLRSEIVNELVGSPENATILDLGCGDGSISLQFQSENNALTLVDISENMLQRARLKIQPEYHGQVELVQADVNSFSPEKKYDLILGIGLLAHVDSVKETIEKIAKLLKKNGLCLLQITDQGQAFTRILNNYNKILDKITGQFGYKRNTLSVKQLIDICNSSGLKLDKSRQYSIMFPGLTFFLPDRLLYAYHSAIKNNTVLSSMGTDFIVSFIKT